MGYALGGGAELTYSAPSTQGTGWVLVEQRGKSVSFHKNGDSTRGLHENLWICFPWRCISRF